MHGEKLGGLDQFLSILTKPDNIPIIGLLFLVFFFTWLAFRQGLRHDKHLLDGKPDEILEDMQR